MPECAKCGSFKLREADYGDVPETSNRADPMAFTSTSVARRDDATLRNLADTYGLSDMSNAGGRAVKQPSPTQGEYGVKEYFGVKCPIGKSITTVSGGTGVSVGAKPGAIFAGQAAAPGRVAAMSEVVAEHRG